MHGRNQIDPYGDDHRLPGHRGATWTGNRDYGESWIICDLDPKWQKDDHKYRRLFFLDEATALAAGFRPCNRCRRKALESFRSTWNTAVQEGDKTAQIDRNLREAGTVRRSAPAGELPVGAMIRFDGGAHLIVEGGMRQWSFEGYGPVAELPKRRVEVLTPAATVEVLKAGYPVALHPSAA